MPMPGADPSIRCQKKKRRGRQGFNLLEVMIASTILIVGATGIFMGMTASTQSEQRMQHLTIAGQVMESVLETLLVLPPQHPWLQPGLHDTGDAPLHFDASGVPVIEGEARYHATWEVIQNRTAKETLNGIHEIEVTVTWEMGGQVASTSWRVHRR